MKSSATHRSVPWPLAIGLAVAVGVSADAAWEGAPGLPLPEAVSALTWAAPVYINGHAALVQSSDVSATPQEVVDFYHQWLGADVPVLEINGQRTMTGLWRGNPVTVALRERASGLVELTLLSRQAGQAPALPAPDQPHAGWLPSGSALFAQVRMPGRDVDVALLVGGNTSSVRTNLGYLKQQLAQHGYHLSPHDEVPKTPSGQVLHAEGVGKQLLISVTDEGRYRSVVIWQQAQVGP